LPAVLGFSVICDDERDDLAKEAAKFIKSGLDRPYFMVVSFINPHDICYYAIRDFATTDFDHRLVEKGVQEIATLDKALKKARGDV
jgi:hypothetical protein